MTLWTLGTFVHHGMTTTVYSHIGYSVLQHYSPTVSSFIILHFVWHQFNRTVLSVDQVMEAPLHLQLHSKHPALGVKFIILLLVHCTSLHTTHLITDYFMFPGWLSCPDSDCWPAGSLWFGSNCHTRHWHKYRSSVSWPSPALTTSNHVRRSHTLGAGHPPPPYISQLWLILLPILMPTLVPTLWIDVPTVTASHTIPWPLTFSMNWGVSKI